jgi:hypothetical protein
MTQCPLWAPKIERLPASGFVGFCAMRVSKDNAEAISKVRLLTLPYRFDLSKREMHALPVSVTKTHT